MPVAPLEDRTPPGSCVTSAVTIAGLAAAAMVLGLIAYVFGPAIPEDYFDQVIFATVYSWRGLLAGHVPYWIPNLALGVPNTNPQNLLFDPLSIVFVVFDLRTANALFVAIHAALSFGSMWLVCRVFCLSRTTTVVTLLTFALCAPALDYWVFAFWPSVATQWVVLPLLVYAGVRLIHAEERRTSIGLLLAVAWGLAFLILACHPGNSVATVVGLSVFFGFCVVLEGPTIPARRFKLVGVALVAVVVACIVGEKVVAIATETLLSQGRIRTGRTYTFYADLFWQLMVRPLMWPSSQADGGHGWMGTAVREFLARGTTGFMPFYGLPFVVVGLYGCLRRPSGVPHRIPLLATYLFTLALTLAPKWAFLYVLSGGATFRDIAVLLGVIMGALGLEELRRAGHPRLARVVIVAQVCFVVTAAVPAFVGVSRVTTPAARAPEWPPRPFPGGDVSASAVNAIRTHAGAAGRRVFLHAGDVSTAALTSAGFNVVGRDFIKGISMDVLYASPVRMYGFLPGQFEYYVDGHYRTPVRRPLDILQRRDLRDALSVGVVIADPASTYGPGLVEVARLAATDGDAVVLANETPWPPAFVAPPTFRDATVARRADCPKTSSVVCGDFEPFRMIASASPPVDLTLEGDVITFRTEPAPVPRVLFVSQMYRPGWRVEIGNETRPGLPLLEAFLGAELPPGVGAGRLVYRPPVRVAARRVANATLLTLFVVTVAWLALSRRRRSGA